MHSPNESNAEGTAMPGGTTHLGSIWGELDAQITPFLYVLTIPGHVFRALEPAAKDFIASTFMNYVDESVMFCRDGTGKDRYFLGHPRHFIRNGGCITQVPGSEPIWFVQNNWDPSSSVALPATPPARAQKIPRPPNAYILYRKDRHEMVKMSRPGITNNEISQILGAAWNGETREVRQEYKKKADDIKAAFIREHPNYQYRPRRSREVKRRARRNTNAAGTSSTSQVAATPTPPPMSDEDTELMKTFTEAWDA